MRVNGRSQRGGSILFFDEADGLFGKAGEIEAYERAVVVGARSLGSTSAELHTWLVIARAPWPAWRGI